MNYITIIIVAVAGIALGAYFARGRKGGLIAEQGKQKKENMQKRRRHASKQRLRKK